MKLMFGKRRRHWVEVEWCIAEWLLGLSFWWRDRTSVMDYEVSLHVGPAIFSLRINRRKPCDHDYIPLPHREGFMECWRCNDTKPEFEGQCMVGEGTIPGF